MITIQYLEPNVETKAVSPKDACAKLQATFDHLPIDAVLLGWGLPEPLVTAVREVTHANSAQLYRWHPLLTGDGIILPLPEWQTVSMSGERVPGFRGMPEFTFVCPNKPAVRDAILRHVQALSQSGLYDGIFLDRMRFPSPAADPLRYLACFCGECWRAAAQNGLALTAVRDELDEILGKPDGPCLILQDLAGFQKPSSSALSDFLEFRIRTITQFIREVAALIRAEEMAVGLDCFAPSLTYMVGQDLDALSLLGDWMKVMTYVHTLGPAGLPYELLELANWLIAQGANEQEALFCLAETLRISLPQNLTKLRDLGLSAAALQGEVGRAQSAASIPLLAGVELVKLQGVTHLSADQIKGDLMALRAIRVDGLSLSWDLWHMPPAYLELVALIFCKEKDGDETKI